MELGNRKFSRYDFSQIIRYSPPVDISGRTSTGLIRDFSYSGLCIITHHPLERGQEIVIDSLLMSESLTAVVRWCDNMGDATYRVGLEIKH